MEINLKEHMWRVIRTPFMAYAFLILITMVAVYLSLIYSTKWHALAERLRTANIAVTSAVEAGDWDLALVNLNANTQAGLFNLTVLSEDEKINYAGPLGKPEFGIGTICTSDLTIPSFKLSGCLRTIGKIEIYSLISFAVLAFSILAFSLVFFRKKNLQLFSNLSNLISEENISEPSGIIEIEAIRRRIAKLITEIERNNKIEIKSQLATQVAHDIRSPLAALKMILQITKEIPETERTFFTHAVNRLENIANELIETNRNNPLSFKPIQIVPILENIITEKKLGKLIKIELSIHKSAFSLFSSLDAGKLATLFSNILNNAIEAITADGLIKVNVFEVEGHCYIEFVDNGPGIPKEYLDKLGQRGATFGKTGGSGLGLYHARTTLESWGGKLVIESIVGEGTLIRVILPLCEQPKWHLHSLNLNEETKIIIIDDDAHIIEIWKSKLETFSIKNQNIITFQNPDLAKKWVLEHVTQGESQFSYKFLIDLEFNGYAINGLELIEGTQINNRAVLVTSRYDDESVIKKCEDLGLKLLPKNQIKNLIINNCAEIEYASIR